MCLPYLVRQSARKPSLMPQDSRIPSNAKPGGNLLLQGETQPGSQTFPLIFTLLHQANLWCYLIIYLFKKYLLSTYAVSGFMQLLELQGTCVLFYDILLFFSLFHPPYPLYLRESWCLNWVLTSPEVFLLYLSVLSDYALESPTFPRGGYRIFHGAGKERMSRWTTLLLHGGVPYKDVFKEKNTDTDVGIR